jgi:hypothetical protein
MGVLGLMILIALQEADQASPLATHSQYIAKRSERLAPIFPNVQFASAPSGARRDSVPNGRQWRISTHWAGYVVTATQSFTGVQASWVQPHIRCDRPESSAAFWVGLGGAAADSQGLEQIGTVADCSERLTPSYSAWYEIIPAGPVEVPINVAPGDTLAAEVNANNGLVSLAIRNLTNQSSFSTELAVPSPDLGSAEWIAEAPSLCFLGECRQLPLASFGRVDYAQASANLDGRTGTIADPAWAAQSITLAARKRTPTAVPTPLSQDGKSFSVIWRGGRRTTAHRQYPRHNKRHSPKSEVIMARR